MQRTIIISSLLALYTCLPAVAGEGTFEITAGAGAYANDSRVGGDVTSFGVRGGYRFTDRWAIQGALSRSDLFDIGAAFHAGDEVTFFDVSGMFFITPGRRAELFVYGGVGMARFESGGIRLSFPTIGGVRVSDSRATVDDEFTTHLGIGVNIRLTERMYLRPDLRSRWLSGFDDVDLEVEPSIGLGWRF